MDESTVGALKRCCKCGEQKPRVAYQKLYKRDGSFSGYAHLCIGCQAAWRAERDRKDALVASGFHECVTCEQAKPVGDFYPCRSAKRGLMSHCKECAAKRPRKRDTPIALHRRKLAALAERGMKICATCREQKQLEQFYPHANGYASYCKACHSATQRERNAKPEFVAKRRAWYRQPEVRAKMQARNDAYWRDPANREKIAARKAVYKAIKAGKLARGPCMECGKPKADAHHHKGYAREHRLDVEWLCKSCHLRSHRSPEPAPSNLAS